MLPVHPIPDLRRLLDTLWPGQLAIAAVTLWPTFARATDPANFTLNTTEDLFVVCSTASSDPMRPEAINFCAGFLSGVVSHHDAIADRKQLKPFIYYPQTAATRDQGIQAFHRLGGQPSTESQVHERPAGRRVRALAAKWPCK